MTNKTTEALKLSTVALKDIACTSQTDDLLWWQIRAREALAAIREASADHVANVGKMVAEPVKQEPVAWMYDDGTSHKFIEPVLSVKRKDFPDGWRESPLYAAPVSAKREWVDLTCQEVTALIMEGAAGGGWQGFAERVQAAYKEKNNG